MTQDIFDWHASIDAELPMQWKVIANDDTWTTFANTLTLTDSVSLFVDDASQFLKHDATLPLRTGY